MVAAQQSEEWKLLVRGDTKEFFWSQPQFNEFRLFDLIGADC